MCVWWRSFIRKQSNDSLPPNRWKSSSSSSVKRYRGCVAPYMHFILVQWQYLVDTYKQAHIAHTIVQNTLHRNIGEKKGKYTEWKTQKRFDAIEMQFVVIWMWYCQCAVCNGVEIGILRLLPLLSKRQPKLDWNVSCPTMTTIAFSVRHFYGRTTLMRMASFKCKKYKVCYVIHTHKHSIFKWKNRIQIKRI